MIKSIPFRAWVVVGLLWFVAMLNYFDRLMLVSMRDPIKLSIPMTDAQFGLLTASFVWIYGLVSPFGGFVADRTSRSIVIIVSLFVWSCMTWLTGHVRTFDEMLIVRALMGISEACYIPAALALIADFHRGRTRSLATGLHMTGLYSGAALGGIGGYIAEAQGWRFGFTLFGIVGIAYSLVLIVFLRDAPKEVSSSEEKQKSATTILIREVISSLASLKGFWVLLGASAIVGVVNWSIYAWMPTYLRERFNLDLGQAGVSASAYLQVASFFGVLIGGFWADQWSRTNVRGRSLVPALGFIVGGPFLFLAASTNVFVLTISGIVIYGLARGFFDSNLMPILRQVTAEQFSATAYGVLNSVGCITGGLMIYAGGALMDAKVDLAIVFQWSASGLILVAFLLYFLGIRPRKTGRVLEEVAQ